MNLAGLDIATTTGLARKIDGKIYTQTFRCPPKKKSILDDSKGLDALHEGATGRRFEDFLQSWLIEHEIHRVAIEAVIVSNTTRTKTVVDTSADFAGQALRKVEVAGTSLDAIYRIYGLNFVAATVCSRLGIPCEFVAQTTWRKAFLGNGRPKDAKDEAVRQCRRLGIDVSSKDAAEAAGILWWLDQKLNPYGNKLRVGDLFANTTPPPPGVSAGG